MREYVVFIHDPNMMFDLKVKFVGPQPFVPIDKVIPYISAQDNVSHDVDIWPQYQNYIFTLNFCTGKNVIAL